tara:strand:+ start:327 stop:524 length:198 start_codon:yes stop_codon:yes gene_type:complete
MGIKIFPIDEISSLRIIENNEIKKMKAFILKIFVMKPFMKLLAINLDFPDVFDSLLKDEIPINIK